MQMKMISLMALLGISLNALAVECPSANDWSHQKGKPWLLNQKSIQAGWLVSQNSNMESSLTTVSPNANLTVNLTPAGAQCLYTLEKPRSMAMAYQLKTPDMGSVSQPPFHGGIAGYSCDTQAGTSAVCRWSWGE